MRSLLLLVAALALPAAPTRGAAQPSAGPEDAPPSEFGEPLVVNGRRISDLEIKRFLIYGVGQTLFGTERLAILVEREMERRAERLERQFTAELFPGKSAEQLSPEELAQVRAQVDEELAQYRVDDGYFDWLHGRNLAGFSQRYPTLDFDTEIGREYGHVKWYELQTRRALEFDECFFHGPPDTWPDITIEALRFRSPEVDLVADMRLSWARRSERAEEMGLPYMPREDETYFGVLRDYVVEMLESEIEQTTAVEGLPEELVLVMEGPGWTSELRTEDLWEHLEPVVTEQDVKIAKRWLALMAATEDRLEKEGHLVSLEDHLEHLRKTDAELEAALFTLDFVAVTGHGFPSTQAFQQYLRPFESYRARLEGMGVLPRPGAALTPILEDYISVARRMVGKAKVDVEVLLVGAFDQANFSWKPDGWARAKEKADRLRTEIDAHLDALAAAEEAKREAAENGENWDRPEGLVPFEPFWAKLMDWNSEFWDPPMPAVGKMPSREGMQNKGRFGRQGRNDLSRCVNESYFTKILTGRSIADRVFLDMTPGDVGGPFPGPQGYYFVYVKGRTPGKALDMKVERERTLLEDEYLRQTFAEYAQESLSMAETSGVPEL